APRRPASRAEPRRPDDPHFPAKCRHKGPDSDPFCRHFGMGGEGAPRVTTATSRRFAENAEEQTRLPAKLRRGITHVTGLTISGQILLVVGVAFWGIGRYAGGRPLYMLAYGVVAVIVVSKVVTRRAPPAQGV